MNRVIQCGPHKVVEPIIGQEAICGDGIGRVVDYCLDFPSMWIQVETYGKNRGCKWDASNVKLIPLSGVVDCVQK